MFERITVQNKKDRIIYETDRFQDWLGRNRIYPAAINFKGKCVKSNDLPYAKELNKLNPGVTIKRENCINIVYRGDNRDIDTIQKSGGFNPNRTIGPSKPNPLDVVSHRINSGGSGFVSVTKSLNVAHSFGLCFARNIDPFIKKMEYTIYAMEVIGEVNLLPNEVKKYKLANIIVEGLLFEGESAEEISTNEFKFKK